VWDKRTLPTLTPWFQNGPFLPLEFARQSSDDRLTLVIAASYAVCSRSLWTVLSVESPEQARHVLGEREGVQGTNLSKHIAVWPCEGSEDPIQKRVGAWARELRLSAVVWTALPPRFNGAERVPALDEALAYLKGLPDTSQRKAERYVRMAPVQIDTPYRRRFEEALGWTPVRSIVDYASVQHSTSSGDATTKGYWETARSRVANFWKKNDVVNCERVYPKQGGTCEMCGYTPIHWHFALSNQRTGAVITVARNCISNFYVLTGQKIHFPPHLRKAGNLLSKLYPGSVLQLEPAVTLPELTPEEEYDDDAPHYGIGMSDEAFEQWDSLGLDPWDPDPNDLAPF